MQPEATSGFAARRQRIARLGHRLEHTRVAHTTQAAARRAGSHPRAAAAGRLDRARGAGAAGRTALRPSSRRDVWSCCGQEAAAARRSGLQSQGSRAGDGRWPLSAAVVRRGRRQRHATARAAQRRFVGDSRHIRTGTAGTPIRRHHLWARPEVRSAVRPPDGGRGAGGAVLGSPAGLARGALWGGPAQRRAAELGPAGQPKASDQYRAPGLKAVLGCVG